MADVGVKIGRAIKSTKANFVIFGVILNKKFSRVAAAQAQHVF